MDKAATPTHSAPEPDTSDRFRRKRDRILDAASRIINDHGLKALTFTAVADAVGLTTTSITYYFKRKEMLAAAALERTIHQTEAMIDQAAQEDEPRDRVKLFVRLYLERSGLVRLGKAEPVALLSDMRALDAPYRQDLMSAYLERIIRRAAALFGAPDDPLNRLRAHVMVDTMHWTRAWLLKYSVGDYERAGHRLMDLFEHGLLPEGAGWTPVGTGLLAHETDVTDDDITPETYLRAATRLINERGYRGTAVDRIAAELNVSKGSFYHHLHGRDDLVLECFRRSYERFSMAQRQTINLPGAQSERLAACVGELLSIQFEGDFPLARITALQVLPPTLRRAVLDRSDRMATRFAGMIADGIAEGSIRPVDPQIASQWITGLINSANDMRPWAVELPDPAKAVATYAHPVAHGLFAPL